MWCGDELGRPCRACTTMLPQAAAFCFHCGASTETDGRPAQRGLPEVVMRRGGPLPTARTAPDHANPSEADVDTTGASTTSATQPVPAPDAGDGLTQYIPPELLRKLQRARGRGNMQGERRVVTMLFCDVTGSTAAAEGMDPEDWAEIMNGAFEHLIRPVYDHEGMLARLMGDAILAFFGAPFAHEDDPERAVRAGLAILEGIAPYRAEVEARWGIGFDVRVGIHTGLVVVGEVGSDLRLEYTAMGDAVNLAARMESSASPGTVQISDATHRLVGHMFDVVERGDLTLKGKSEPVRAWCVVGEKEAASRHEGGLDTALVGREEVLGDLREAVRGVLDGRGGVLSVLGAPGLGKSRLLSETRVWASGREVPPQWHEGRCQSFRSDRPLWPFAEIVRSGLGLPRTAGDDEVLSTLVGAMEARPGLDGPRILPALGTLLGVSVNAIGEAVAALGVQHDSSGASVQLEVAEADVAQQQRALELLLLDAAAEAPLVLVLEDVQWIDAASETLVDRLMQATGTAALLLVLAHRPVREGGGWRLLETARRDLPHLLADVSLSPLSDDQIERLVVETVPDVVWSPELMGRLRRRAEGNPFFVEEMLRTLIDAGHLAKDDDGDWVLSEARSGDLQIPDSLTGVITSRLDQLSEAGRLVAQTASVLGREFEVPALERLVDDGAELREGLAELQRRGLIREVARRPIHRFRFSNAMTPEVAHASMLRRDRRLLHGIHADALLAGEAPTAEVASHLEAAERWAEALPLLVAAAGRAHAEGIPMVAHDLAVRASEALERTGDADSQLRYDVALLRGRSELGRYDFERACAAFDEAIEIARDIGNGTMLLEALSQRLWSTLFGHGAAASDPFLQEVEHLADELGDVEGQEALWRARGFRHAGEGRPLKAGDALGMAAKLADQRQEPLIALEHAMTHGHMLALGGWPELAAPIVDDVERRLEAHPNRMRRCEHLCTGRAYRNFARCELATTVAECLEAAEIAREDGAGISWTLAEMHVTRISKLLGDYEVALEHAELARRASLQTGRLGHTSNALAHMVGVRTIIDPHSVSKEEGHPLLELGQEMISVDRGITAWTPVELAFLALRRGEDELAATWFEEGLTRKTIAKGLVEPMVRAGRAILAMLAGDLEGAGEELELACAGAEERSLNMYTPALELVAAHLAHERLEPAVALTHAQRAVELARRHGMRPALWQGLAAVGYLQRAASRHDEARTAFAEARVVLDELADQFEQPETRAAFRKTTDTAMLAGIGRVENAALLRHLPI